MFTLRAKYETRLRVRGLAISLLIDMVLGTVVWVLALVECSLAVGQQVFGAWVWFGLFIGLCVVQGISYILFLVEGGVLKEVTPFPPPSPPEPYLLLFHHYRMVITYLSSIVLLSSAVMIPVSVVYDTQQERFKQYLTLYIFPVFPVFFTLLVSSYHVLRLWNALESGDAPRP